MTKLDAVRRELEPRDMGAIDAALEADADAYAADVKTGQLPPAICALLERVRRAPAISDETDQGWRNHETMLTAAQLAGNMTPGGEDELRLARKIAKGAISWAETHEGEDVRSTLAGGLRRHIEHRTGRHDGLAGDLLASALERVDWLELAEQQLGELAELEGGEE